MEQQYTSILLERAVTEISNLPGIGRKTALRLALHLLHQEPSATDRLADALTHLRHDVKHCRLCHNISDTELCPICASGRRDASLVCVVENIQDVMAIENTQQYSGLYHVLGGLISPMDGVGPSQIEIDSLVERVRQTLTATANDDCTAIQEVILALSSTMEGDTTAFYINRRLAETGVKVSVIARGISVGNELEYTDELTLGRSILNRIPFDG
ncbi:MAG: recombination mediator RecR [Prevotella sp.]|nr:recombination mediator RecR [Prevotella sp.]